MPISIDKYISITSGVIGSAAVSTRQLVGLRMTTSPRVPVDAIVSLNSASEAVSYFGAGSDEAVFTALYFGYVSPAPVSKPKVLRFGAYADTARLPTIYGGTHSTLTALQAITSGLLTVTIGGSAINLSGISFSAAASLADVATIVQTAVRASGGSQFTGATVTYDANWGQFVLAGTVAESATISASGNVATSLGWSSSVAIYSTGSPIQTPLEAITAVDQISDNFGAFSFGSDLSTDDIAAVGAWVASLNIKYLYIVRVTLDNYADIVAALGDTNSVGLVVGDAEVLPLAIQAATDYTRANATVNYMYRQLSSISPTVTTMALSDLLDSLKVNYYGQTASAGQKISFFQRGTLLGTSTSPSDMGVHSNEQWLKASVIANLLSLQLSLGKIPANADGRGYIINQLESVVVQAKRNGSISVDKTLTTEQKITIFDLTQDGNAWQAVQSNGYYLSVTINPVVTNGVTEYTADYLLVYSKMDVVRTIKGSHNLI